jgi:hypothetical protein
MDGFKDVTYKNLVVEQEIRGHKREGYGSSSYSAIVKNINSAYVTVMMWGKREEQIDSRSLFSVKMTRQELEVKHKETEAEYRERAKEVLVSLKNKLHRDEIGCHEMSNAWVYGTPYEIAQHCEKDGIKVVGYCPDICPKIAMFTGDTLDIGVCAEDEDGERFWCHFRYADIERMYIKYKDLLVN